MGEEAHGPSQRIQHKTQHGLQEGEAEGSAKGTRPQGHGATWCRPAGAEKDVKPRLPRPSGAETEVGEGEGWPAPHEPSGQ